MEAIIRTNDRTLFEALLPFLKTLHISVERKEEKTIQQRMGQKPAGNDIKKFNPREYRGILSHLNLDIEKELQNMKNTWKKRNF